MACALDKLKEHVMAARKTKKATKKQKAGKARKASKSRKAFSAARKPSRKKQARAGATKKARKVAKAKPAKKAKRRVAKAAKSVTKTKKAVATAKPKAVKRAPKPAAPPVAATKRLSPKPVAKSVVQSGLHLVKDAVIKPALELVEKVVRPAPQAERSTYYVTTAISYPNGVPHIGHAYEAIATDALARFQRLDGKDVFFLTGTDEHGLKMVQTAARENLSVQEFAARNAGRFKAMDERLNVSFDRFIRTTEDQHHRSSQLLWNRVQQNGDIYLSTYSGWYSVRDEAYYDEAETTVGEDNVRRGPQGSPVEWVDERSYFFRLSAYQDRLLKLYEDQPDFIGPDSRRNEIVSFVKSGLKDLSVSRTTFDWGVKVPNDPEHVMYVWFDALTNYITGAGFPDETDANWKYWPADVHIIGKDIIRFHAVFWPAFLMSAGIPVPKRVYAHGFLFNRGEKMSKSVGNVVDPFNLADQYGVDQVRYFFLREVPFGQDGNYNHEAIVARINADLANDLGNLAQRSLSMIGKQLSGIVPEPSAFSDNDKTILAQADGMLALARGAMKAQQIHQALNAIFAVVAEANRYFAGEAPWALAKTDPARQKTVLYVTAEVIRQIGILTQPFMPEASAKLLDLLALPTDARNFAALATRLAAGSQLPPPAPVFPRYLEPKEEGA
jgi:methionyl-tRNA synthetase